MLAIEKELARLWSTVEDINNKLDKAISHDSERLRDIKWAAWYCGVSTMTIYNWINKMGFPFLKVDGNNSPIRFRKKDIDLWIDKNMKI